MKFEKAKRLFLILLFLSLVLRVLQEIFTLDGKTGFVIPEYKAVFVVLTVLFFLIVAAACVLGFVIKQEKYGFSETAFLYIPALLAGVLIFAEMFNFKIAETTPRWQITALYIGNIIAAAFFIVYSVLGFLKIKMPKILYVAPLIYSAVKLIRIFSKTSSLALIADNAFSVISVAAMILFFLEFAKAENGFTEFRERKRLFASSFAFSVLGLGISVPQLFNVILGKAVLHDSIFSLIITVFISIFAFFYGISYSASEGTEDIL